MRIFGLKSNFSRGKRLFRALDRLHTDSETQTAVISALGDQLEGIRVELGRLNTTLLAIVREEYQINPQSELPADLMGVEPPDAEYPNEEEEAIHQLRLATDESYRDEFRRSQQRMIDPERAR